MKTLCFVRKPANKKPVVDRIGRNLRFDRADRLDRAYHAISESFPRKPCPSLPGIASVLKLMAQHGLNPKAGGLKPEDIADTSVCKNWRTPGSSTAFASKAAPAMVPRKQLQLALGTLKRQPFPLVRLAL